MNENLTVIAIFLGIASFGHSSGNALFVCGPGRIFCAEVRRAQSWRRRHYADGRVFRLLYSLRYGKCVVGPAGGGARRGYLRPDYVRGQRHISGGAGHQRHWSCTCSVWACPACCSRRCWARLKAWTAFRNCGSVSPVWESIQPSACADVPVLGEVFFSHSFLTYGAYALVPIAIFVFNRTTWGLECAFRGPKPGSR